MELFGFGTPSELSTPIGQMVKHATDNLRMVPDWTKNLEICDLVNGRLENIDAALKAIHRRLQDSNHTTVQLTLILLETCMKNCGSAFAASFDRHLMDDVTKIAKGSRGLKNSDDALRLIQQWARVFETRRATYPLFFDTFMALKAKGVTFPPEDANAISGYDMGTTPAARRPSASAHSPAAAPAPAARRAPAPTAPSSVQADEEDDFFRLQRDMLSVMDKVKLCREMLLVSPGIEDDEALADVVGFLEACRDRMADVIEAGTQGLLGEELFSTCLKVNDAILRTLDAERTGTKIAVEDEEGDAKPQANGLLDLDSIKPTAAPALASVPAKTTLVDDLAAFSLAPVAATAAAAPSIVSNPFDDPFSASYGQGPTAEYAKVFPPAPPAHVVAAAVAAPTPASNPFENNPFGDSAVLPPAHVAQKTADDFQIFSAPAAVAVAAAAAPTGAPSVAAVPPPAPGAEEDFDAFFASLDKP